MSSTVLPSLRDRQKAETWLTLHQAAVASVLERGLDSATVETITARAGVSQRTFFNYFPSKEDAVLGLRTPVMDPALLEGFSFHRDVLGQVSRLLLAVALSAYEGVDQVRRRELTRQYPHLVHRMVERMNEAEDLVRSALTGLLAENPQWFAGMGEEDQPADVADVARIVVMTASIPLRFTVASGRYSPAAGLAPDDLAPALSLFHSVQRKLL
ncbi:TetR/AcrR family transcriptional regulator [Arthrobacter cheniae]|nr:TetR/AcrR family transcriptional regulator [Arthrobacter cheniae]